jgi:hypothetical protein
MDAWVLLLDDVIPLWVTRAPVAHKLANRWVIMLEAQTAIIAPVDDGAARKLDWLATAIHCSSRPVTGVQIGPQLAIAHNDGVRFASG